MSVKVISLMAFAIGAQAAVAAPTRYDVAFRFENLGSTVEYIDGSFSFVADPGLMTNIEDIEPSNLNISTALLNYDTSSSKIDFWQHVGVPWGFLVGRVFPFGGDDNNIVSTSRIGDYVLVVQFLPDFSFVRANGTIVYPQPPFGTGTFLGINTDQGKGTLGFWNVIASPAAPVGAIPEPATWAIMIAGFGLVGAAARRRRTMAAMSS